MNLQEVFLSQFSDSYKIKNQIEYVLQYAKNTLCSEKKHPLTFSFISLWVIVDLNKNCSEYT